MIMTRRICLGLLASVAVVAMATAPAFAQKKANVVVLMTDDTGWADFGCYLGGAALGHPTPNIDRVAKEGVMFTNWYGQASCTAGRASFMTGRIPIRSALSVVVVPGDPNGLRRQAGILPDRAWLRRDEAFRRVLPGRLRLQRHISQCAPVVPER
jgi:hypothetical protein